MDTSRFKFYSSFADVIVKPGTPAVLPKEISTPDELFRELARLLKFPSYFGDNWNALYDCLRDFHWCEEFEVVLAHEDVPAIPADDLKIYIEVLRDSIVEWRDGEDHKFTVYFNVSDRDFMNRL